MAIFGPKPSTLWKNVNFRTFQSSCFYSLERPFFVLEYHKRHFAGLYCLKKKVGKMAIFGPKPWVNPFAKMSIFGLFELVVFIAQKGVSSFQNILKTFSIPILPKKKKIEKWPFLNQNHGLTRLQKCHFSVFLNFFFLQPRKAFFRSTIS